MEENIDPSNKHSEGTGADVSNATPTRGTRAVTKRLQKELKDLMMANETGISAFPEGDNIFKWVGTIVGPRGTVYEAQTYRLSLGFLNTYPYIAPVVKFVTPIFHPNVSQTGIICLDILQDQWTVLYDVRTLLLSIQSLLGEPNNKSPLNLEAAKLWNDKAKYKKYLDEFYKEQKDN